MKSTEKWLALLTLSFVLFIDAMSIGLIYPIMPGLFFSAQHPLVSNPHYAHIFYGITFAIFPAMSIIGMPLLGILSDKYSRKKILILGLGGVFLSYLLCMGAIWQHSLSLFLLGRAIGGFSAGSYPVSDAMIADLSKSSKDFLTNLLLPAVATILGFICGPAITLAASFHTSPIHRLILPFVAASILSLLNALLVMLIINPKYFPNHHPQDHAGLKQWIKNLVCCFQCQTTRWFMLSYLFISLLWGILMQGLPAILKLFLGYGMRKIAIIYLVMGISALISMGLNVLFSQFIRTKTLLLIDLFLTLLACLALILYPSLLADKISYFVLILLWLIPTLGFTALIPELIPQKQVGGMIGAAGAVNSASYALGGLILTTLILHHLSILFALLAILGLISSLTFLFCHRKL